VIIYIDEPTTPAKPTRIESHSRGKGNVIKCSLPRISIEGRSITGEVSLEDIQPPVMVVVRRCYAHPSLWLAVDTQAATCLDANIRESSILVVVVQRCRSRIVGYVDIRPAIIVKIDGQYAETVSSVGLGNPRFFRRIRKRTIPIVVIESICSTGQSRWSARYHDALVLAGPGFR